MNGVQVRLLKELDRRIKGERLSIIEQMERDQHNLDRMNECAFGSRLAQLIGAEVSRRPATFADGRRAACCYGAAIVCRLSSQIIM
jgi:hypothetical protein